MRRAAPLCAPPTAITSAVRAEDAMFEAAISALAQMFSPPLRTVLWRSIGLALVLIVIVGIALDRLLVWLVGSGAAWFEAAVGPGAHMPMNILTWMLSIAAGLGIVVGAIFLMPAVTALVGSFFVDEIGEVVERTHYPADPPGRALPLARAMLEGAQTALLAVLVYLCAVPFLLFAGFGALIFFFATAWLLGREYFELAAMRFHPPADARALRKRNGSTVFLAGMFIAAFVSIPIVNLATPLFGMAFMVHMHKRLARGE
jgi:uncharacterized protein involved in cysteine biosynthesis